MFAFLSHMGRWIVQYPMLIVPVSVAALCAVAGSGQRNDAKVNPQQGPTKKYFGISACTTCHTQPPDKDVVLCRCTEVGIWREKDKHKNAYNVLSGDRA